MARITIEDSLKTCPNVYDLIRLASKRAHQLQRGAEPKISALTDKQGRPDAPTVIALREIAAGFTDFDNIEIPETDAYGRKIFRRPEQQIEEQDYGTDIL